MEMNLAHYYTMKTIGTNQNQPQSKMIDLAKDFCNQYFSQKFGKFSSLNKSQHQEIQNQLLTWFLYPDQEIEKLPFKIILISFKINSFFILIWEKFYLFRQILAGLCLRCYLSHRLFIACQNLPRKYVNYPIKLRDIFPLVLNDDGQLIISCVNFEENGKIKTQLVRFQTEQGHKLIGEEQCLSLHICLKFKPERNKKLENFAYTLTQQSSVIKNFLKEEYGIIPYSDWRLLCMEDYLNFPHFKESDRQIIEVFHKIYRQYIQENPQQRRYPEPTKEQLIKMLGILARKANFSQINNSEKLLKNLKRIANLIRQYEVFRLQGKPPKNMIDDNPNYDDEKPFNPEIADPQSYTDVSEQIFDLQIDDFSNFLHHKLVNYLDQAIKITWDNHLENIKFSRRSNQYYDLIIPALRYFYFDGISQGEIVDLCGFRNREQVLRILNLTNNINQIKTRVNSALLKAVIAEVKDLKLEISKDQEKLDQLINYVEDFTQKAVFEEALGEVRGNIKNSVYARRLRLYLNDKTINL